MARCAQSFRRWGNVIRDFVAGGQLLDLAVALIIGHTFEEMIKSFVDHLLVPILGFIFDGIDIALLNTNLTADRWSNKAPVNLPYGKVLQRLIYFAVITITLSLTIAIIDKIFKTRGKNQVTPVQLPTKQELILMEQTNILKTIAQSLRR
jgi:large conductance mechanosensitive channel